MEMLSGVRIVELAGGLAVSAASLLLAEMGAEVVRIETGGANPTLFTAQFSVVNRSKTRVVLDLATPAGRDELDRLLAGADILFHDVTPGRAVADGIDSASLAARNPELIAVAIGALPPGHPFAELPPVDMLALGAAGVLDEQAAVGRDGPIYLRFPLGSWGAGFLAAVGALAKLLARTRGAAAGSVETSLLQGALASLSMHWYRAERPTQSLRDGMPKTTEAPIFECGDGVWVHVMANADHVPLVAAALECLTLEDRTPIPPTTTYARLFPLLPANRKAFLTRPSIEWLEALWAADIPVQSVKPMGELYRDEQAIANGFVVSVDDPVFGQCLQPACPVSVDPPARVRGPAIVSAALPTWPARTPVAKNGASPHAPHTPLAGLRILDLGNFLAGPFAMMLAADLGADVIKIEATTGDQMRWIDWSFNGCQRGKRSLALQLKNPGARDLIARLVAGADVVHHNLRMPAARKLGVDYDTLRAIKPDLIYCHVNSYGDTGPRKDWPGYDQLFQAASGWEQEAAGPGNRPIWMRFGMMDHLAAMGSLCATLAALHRRDQTGQGAFVSASLMATAMLTMSETIMLADGTLTPFARLNADQTGVDLRQRLYHCRDGWVAVLCPSELAWTELTQAARDGEIEAMFAAQAVADALASAARAGAIAVHVRENQRHAFLDDPDMQAAHLVTSYPHPEYGKLEQVGSFWTFGGAPCQFRSAPPTLGQHSRGVLAEVGYSSAQIDELVAAGVIVAA